jgi:hypothetical protein
MSLVESVISEEVSLEAVSAASMANGADCSSKAIINKILVKTSTGTRQVHID